MKIDKFHEERIVWYDRIIEAVSSWGLQETTVVKSVDDRYFPSTVPEQAEYALMRCREMGRYEQNSLYRCLQCSYDPIALDRMRVFTL